MSGKVAAKSADTPEEAIKEKFKDLSISWETEEDKDFFAEASCQFVERMEEHYKWKIIFEKDKNEEGRIIFFQKKGKTIRAYFIYWQERFECLDKEKNMIYLKQPDLQHLEKI